MPAVNANHADAPRYNSEPVCVPKVFKIALGVTSVGVAEPPVRLAFTVPAAIVAR